VKFNSPASGMAAAANSFDVPMPINLRTSLAVGQIGPSLFEKKLLQGWMIFHLPQYLTLDVTRYSSLYFSDDKVVQV